MVQTRDSVSGVLETDSPSVGERPRGPNRRKLLGQVGAAATFAAGALASPSVSSAQAIGGNSNSPGGVAPLAGVTNRRVMEAMELRVAEAIQDARVPAATNVTNGDEARYADKGGTYTKGLPHDSFGRVNLTAYQTFKTALNSGEFSDFQNIIMGGTRTLNGPQGGLAFCLDALDGVQFGQPQVPPAPPTASDQNATELLEHYWASLLRDVAFTDYRSNSIVAQAAAELGSQPTYLGPRNSSGQVTPNLLFRGVYPGETLGPYISQLFLQPTFFGPQPIDQQQVTYLPNIDYGTDFTEWLNIQNGIDTRLRNQVDPLHRYRRNSRDLAAFGHVDVLYQAYFTAYLMLAGVGAPLNPGNPYNHSKTENGFGTFGGPDTAGTLTAVATVALNAVWYQKWFVHLRPRPEAIGGLVHLIKTGQGNKTDVKLSNVILNSRDSNRASTSTGLGCFRRLIPKARRRTPPTRQGTEWLAALASRC